MGVLVETIEELCNEVLSKNDGQRALLMQKLENILKTNQKRPMEPMEDSNLRKKAKLDLVEGNTALPNELWLKIMNYLPTKALFRTFALVNKKFYSLTLDPKAVKYLQLHGIHAEEFEGAKAISRRYKHIVELSIDATYNREQDPGTWQELIEHFIKSDINNKMKSLKVSVMDTSEDNSNDMNMAFLRRYTNFWDIIERHHFDHFDWKGVSFDNELMTIISQMKNLKTLRMSDPVEHIWKHEVVDDLATNINQLNAIEMDYIRWDTDGAIDMRKSLNNLFEKNKESLKIVKLHSMAYNCRCKNKSSDEEDDDEEDCVPLSLNVCQNLEEFRGISLNEHDYQVLSQVSTLKKLELHRILASDLKCINSIMPRLEYLSIDFRLISHPCSIFRQLSSVVQYFPNLERVQISYKKLELKLTEHCPFREFEAAEKNFDHVIKDLRKLKSIQIDVNSVGGIDITNQHLYDLFKSTGVLVIFGKVKENQLSIRQKEFENFLEDDPTTLGHYMIKKRKFVEWCKNNPEYGS